MRKVLLIIALIVLGVQSCFAAEISEARFDSNEKLRYPVVHTGNSAIDDKINVAIIAEVDRFSTGIHQNAAFNGYKVGDIHTDYEIACNQDGNTVILSIVMTESRYFEGAAHPATWQHTLNFNMSSGNRMGLDYLNSLSVWKKSCCTRSSTKSFSSFPIPFR